MKWEYISPRGIVSRSEFDEIVNAIDNCPENKAVWIPVNYVYEEDVQDLKSALRLYGKGKYRVKKFSNGLQISKVIE